MCSPHIWGSSLLRGYIKILNSTYVKALQPHSSHNPLSLTCHRVPTGQQPSTASSSLPTQTQEKVQSPMSTPQNTKATSSTPTSPWFPPYKPTSQPRVSPPNPTLPSTGSTTPTSFSSGCSPRVAPQPPSSLHSTDTTRTSTSPWAPPSAPCATGPCTKRSLSAPAAPCTISIATSGGRCYAIGITLRK